MTSELGEIAVGEPFEEHSTRVGMQLRSDLPRAWDVEFTDVHLTDLAVRIGPRWHISADPTRTRDYGTSRWWHVDRPRIRYALVPNTIHCATEKNRWRSVGRGRRGR